MGASPEHLSAAAGVYSPPRLPRRPAGPTPKNHPRPSPHPTPLSPVAGAANFEKSPRAEVTNARASVGRVNLPTAPTDTARLAEYEQAQNQLSSALSRLLVVSENYPQLRATKGFQDLQVQLEGTENRI